MAVRNKVRRVLGGMPVCSLCEPHPNASARVDDFAADLPEHPVFEVVAAASGAGRR